MEKEEALGWRGEMERCCIQTSSTHSLTTPFALIVLAQLTRPTHFQLKRKKERKKKKEKKAQKKEEPPSLHDSDCSSCAELSEGKQDTKIDSENQN